jgi:hypothetical protein
MYEFYDFPVKSSRLLTNYSPVFDGYKAAGLFRTCFAPWIKDFGIGRSNCID